MKKIIVFSFVVVSFLCSCSDTGKLSNTTFTSVSDIDRYISEMETDGQPMRFQREIVDEKGQSVGFVFGSYVGDKLFKLEEMSRGGNLSHYYRFYLKDDQLVLSTQEEAELNNGGRPIQKEYRIYYGKNSLLQATSKEYSPMQDREVKDMSTIQAQPFSPNYSSLMKANSKRIRMLSQNIQPEFENYKGTLMQSKEKLEKIKSQQSSQPTKQ